MRKLMVAEYIEVYENEEFGMISWRSGRVIYVQS